MVKQSCLTNFVNSLLTTRSTHVLCKWVDLIFLLLQQFLLLLKKTIHLANVWNSMFDGLTNKKLQSPSSLRILAKFYRIHPNVSLKQWKITSYLQSNTAAFSLMMHYFPPTSTVSAVAKENHLPSKCVEPHV